MSILGIQYFSILKISRIPAQVEHPVTFVCLAVVLGAFVGILFSSIVILRRQGKMAHKLSVQLGWWKEQTLQGRWKFLSDQTNTHFLFNSLASLSALIAEDSKMAIHFAGNLAEVYRYVLMVYEKQLVTLQEETSFLKNYFDLIHSRFGSSILFCDNIPDHLRNRQLPPLTLQLLVENALKHNTVSPTKPLYITISGEIDALVVENNLQLKAVKAPSTNIGLDNIRERYQLVGNRNILVQHTDTVFRVTVPLI